MFLKEHWYSTMISRIILFVLMSNKLRKKDLTFTVLGLKYLARPGLLSTANINSEVGPEFSNSPFNAVSKLQCFFYLQTKFILLLITLRLRY